MAPVFVILHFSGIEPFEWPADGATWGYLCLNSVFGTVISDFLSLWAQLLTTPVILALGESLNIPIALAIDTVRGELRLSAMYIFGTLMTFGAFALVNVSTYYDVASLGRRWLQRVLRWPLRQCRRTSSPRSPAEGSGSAGERSPVDDATGDHARLLR